MSDNPLSSQLLLRSETGDEARFENLPAPVMQALYHQLTGKTERIVLSTNGHYVVRMGDILSLMEKFGQTLQQFNHRAHSVTVTVNHYQKDKVVFSSIEKFRQYDISKPDKTDWIEITLGKL